MAARVCEPLAEERVKIFIELITRFFFVGAVDQFNVITEIEAEFNIGVEMKVRRQNYAIRPFVYVFGAAVRVDASDRVDSMFG